jgi:CspA family cold shock protein
MNNTLKLPPRKTKEGRIKLLGEDFSYGFIVATDGSGETFIHLKQAKQTGVNKLVDGQQVSYSIKQGEDGRVHAWNIQLI